MKLVSKTNLFVAGALVALGGCAMKSTHPVSWDNADIHTVSVMMSEPMMKVDGGYHELLDSYYLKPKMTEDKVVLAPVDDMLDELNGTTIYDGSTVTYQLNGKTVEMTLGSTEAMVDGEAVTAPAVPEMVDEGMYVPFKFVFEALGGKYKWISSRKLAQVSILRPAGTVFKSSKGPFSIKTIYKQEADWFGSTDAIAVADAMVANQNADGGWFKLGSSDDLARVFDRDILPTYRQKSSIDNDATYVQITTLSKVFDKTEDERYKASALAGIEYLLEGQYDSGGWPQFFPITTGYHKHITINDFAMPNVLTVLGKVAKQDNEYRYVPDDVAARAQTAVDKGMNFLLDQQVVVNGVKTAWCAQYNAETMECARGRSYELASISGGESVNIIRFLMSIENPSSDVIDAVNSAVAFFDSQRIENEKLVDVKDDSMFFAKDRVRVANEGSDLWPRFIEIDTLKPLFSNRQGDRLYNYEDVSYERRIKYRWLVGAPAKMLSKEYPKWQAKYSPQYSALN